MCYLKIWIARDKDGTLGLYKLEPILDLDGESWALNSNAGVMYKEFIEIDKDLFPQVTFENSPQQVEIKFKNNEKD